MKNSFLFTVFFLLIFLFSFRELLAFGKKEEPGNAPVNTEWILCITAPDVSGLPLVHQITGDTVSRNLLKTLQGLNFRQRGDEEAAYYKDFAWTSSRAAAAKALSTKRAERDLLIYKGDRPWRYRKSLRTVDDAILKLEADLAKIDAVAPVVERKPAFKLAASNISGTFPKPPEDGNEYRFCTGQKADAFLVSSLLEYHDRIFLTVRMYTLYNRSFSYEDSVLFSSDDIIGAMEEISGRLVAAVSSINQAGIVVKASPEESTVIIEGSFAEMGEIRTYSPGTVEVAVHSNNYMPVSVPVELRPGELAELFINLTPMGLAAFEANVPGKPGSKVFVGSLYAGETPLKLELPRSAYTYVSVETVDGQVGSIIYRDNDLVKGKADFVWADNSRRADFATSFPVSSEEKRVDRARRGFYAAYGAFWVILPVSLIAAGLAGNHIDAYNYYTASPGADSNSQLYKDLYDSAVRYNYVRIGAHIAWGTALAVTISQIVRYLYVSGGDSTPIVRVSDKETDIETGIEDEK